MASPRLVIFDRNHRRAEVLAELRRLLPRIEGIPVKALPFGVPTLDAHLPGGGLACGALHEIAPAEGDMPAAFGFLTALLSRMPQEAPVLLVTSVRALTDYGRPYGHGLNALGLDPARVILAEAGNDREALWAMEEALQSGAPAAVAGVIRSGLGLKASQRLHLAANTAGLPLLVLRPAQADTTTAAATRWRIAAAEAERDRFGLIARWRWRVELARCRNGRPGKWLMEWDHVAHCFSLATAMANPACPCAGHATVAVARIARS